MRHPVVWLTGIVAVGVGLRMLSAFNVITPEGVWFLGPDAWYHMRLAEYSATIGQLLHPLTYDPLSGPVGYMPLLPLTIAVCSRLLGLLPGITTAGVIEYVGAAIPVVAAGLTIVAVYALAARVVRGTRAALLAAFLVAVMPGQYLARTLFGYADHHALEVLFTVTALLGVTALRTRWGFSLTTLSVCLLILAWQGALLFVAVMVASFTLRDLWHYLKGTPHWPKRAELTGTRLFAVLVLAGGVAYGLLFHWGYSGMLAQVAGMLALAFTPAMVQLLPRWRWVWLRAGTLDGLSLLAVGLACLVPWGDQPAVVYVATILRNVFVSMDGVVEASGTTLRMMWVSYGLVTPFAVIGLAVVFLRQWDWRRAGPFLVWSVVMLAMALGQQRWHYYLIVPMSILAGYGGVLVFQAAITRARPVMAGVEVALLVLVSVPFPSTAVTLSALPGMTPELHEAMVYLRDQTPPGTDYSVLAWWDHGTYIMRLAERRPVASAVDQFHLELDWFRAQSDVEAESVLQGTDVRYIVLTADMLDGKWVAVARGFPPITRVEPVVEMEASIAYRLWHGIDAPGYTRLFENDGVQIYTRTED